MSTSDGGSADRRDTLRFAKLRKWAHRMERRDLRRKLAWRAAEGHDGNGVDMSSADERPVWYATGHGSGRDT